MGRPPVSMKRTSTDNDRRSVGPKRQGLNAKVSRFDHPPPFICLNSDQSFEVTGQVKLFCSELCKEEAKFVRYFRRCSHDGRINQADVQEALEIRFAHIMAGGLSGPRTSSTSFNESQSNCQRQRSVPSMRRSRYNH